MLIYTSSSIWDSPAQTIVNTVNTVGVMGKGIALEFKKKYPDMFKQYKNLCTKELFQTGKLWLYKSEDRYVLNFPTKKHWRSPSKEEYITSGLAKFVANYERLGITSISFPQLGTGNGGLDWEKTVKPIMEHFLNELPIPVYVHLFTKQSSDAPEHLIPISSAIPFDTLWDDFVELQGKDFQSLFSTKSIKLEDVNSEQLVFKIDEQHEVIIPTEYLRKVWADLNTTRISRNEVFQKNTSVKIECIYTALSKITYIRTVFIGKNEQQLRNTPSPALAISKPRFLQESEQETLQW